MRALVKPSKPPYQQVILESSWGDWIRNHLEKYISMGWTLLEDYVPSDPEDV